MATVINKIVKCTLEQYETLLKTGQVEINGVIHYKEEGTLYLPYELDFIDFYNRVKERELFRYEISHTPVAMKSLEQEYEELTADEGGKESVHISAVGFTAILKSGDTIRITAPNGGNFYINGERLTHDYTFTGEGCEVVNVWVFEGRYGNQSGSAFDNPIGPPILNDTPTFAISELDVRNISQTPVVGADYKNYAQTIRTYCFDTHGAATKKLISNGNTSLDASFANLLQEFESDCTILPKTDIFAGKTNLKVLNFPDLKVIQEVSLQSQGFAFKGCTNPQLIINFPNLENIGGNTTTLANAQWNTTFEGVKRVIIPQSVRYIGRYSFSSNEEIILHCTDANIHNDWCTVEPTSSFWMATGWKGSINIAVAAFSKTRDWFIDLFVNILAQHQGEEDLGDGGLLLDFGEITIPQAMFEELKADEEGQAALKIAKDKNWIVGGA